MLSSQLDLRNEEMELIVLFVGEFNDGKKGKWILVCLPTYIREASYRELGENNFRQYVEKQKIWAPFSVLNPPLPALLPLEGIDI